MNTEILELRTIETVERERERERERESYSLNNIVCMNNKKGNTSLSGKYYDTG